METEILKTHWEELSRRLERQQIITRTLLENTARQRRWSIAAYTWFNLAGLILGIPIVFGIACYRGLEHAPILYISIGLLVSFIPWVAYQTIQLRRMERMQGDIIQQELCTVRYAKAVAATSIYGALVFAGFISYLVAVRTEWIAAGYAGSFKLLVIFFICALAASALLYRWEAGRIRALRRALGELREFTEE